jgi:hypothetical protein
MDAFGTVASVFGTLEIALRATSAPIKYTHDVKTASIEKQMLADETASLLQILERLQIHMKDARFDSSWLESRQEIVRQFQMACNDLSSSLKVNLGTGKLNRASKLLSAAKWAFSKSEVYSLLKRVTRLQQYANTLLVTDQR